MIPLFSTVSLSLRTRFVLGMGIMLLPLVVLMVAGRFYLLPRIIRAFEAAAQEAVGEMHPVMRLQKTILRAAMPPNDYLIHGHPEERVRFLQWSRRVDRAFQEALAAPLALKEKRVLIQAAWEEWRRARDIAQGLLALSDPVGNPAAAREMERFDACIDRAVDILERVHVLALREIEQHLALAHTIARKVSFLVAVVLGVGLGIALVSGVLLARSVLRPLRRLEQGADRIGEGDLAYRVPLAPKDELGRLAQTFNAMAEKLEKIQAALEDQAVRDSLTGLYNRREFYRRIQEELERARRYRRSFALLMLDIDDFKAINDTYGHPAGDEVLRAVASMIDVEIRPGDSAARYGGDEIAIILPETSASGAMALAERLREFVSSLAVCMSAPPRRVLRLTVSIGVAVFPEDARSVDALIAAVDRALYAAKEGGRNRVCRAAGG